jgi:hypothetical protein
MGSSGCWLAAHLAGLGRSESDRLADKDDMDAAGQFLLDFQDLLDLAVLAAGDGGSACGS